MQVCPAPHCALIEQVLPLPLQWPELVQIVWIGPPAAALGIPAIADTKATARPRPRNSFRMSFSSLLFRPAEDSARLYLSRCGRAEFRAVVERAESGGLVPVDELRPLLASGLGVEDSDRGRPVFLIRELTLPPSLSMVGRKTRERTSSGETSGFRSYAKGVRVIADETSCPSIGR
jgi:hypothetical protein